MTEQTKPRIIADYITTHYPKATPAFNDLDAYLLRNDEFADQEGSITKQKKNKALDRILCTGTTGLGTIAEKEYIVLGPKDKIDEVQFIPID